MLIDKNTSHRRPVLIGGALILLAVLVLWIWRHPSHDDASGGTSPPPVTVSKPIQRTLSARSEFLGQFSAIESVELRAQVGGILTEIHFTDGQIVHQGDLLFVIDTRPYQIKLDEAAATLTTTKARLTLATTELKRAQELRQSGSGSVENLERRTAEFDAAQAAVQAASQSVKDAHLDLEYCHIVAPFTGQMSKHLISKGNLVAGSRAGGAGTTLLSTIVTVNPIWLDFDMSEGDFLAYKRAQKGSATEGEVTFTLSDQTALAGKGKMDFIDNVLDRTSGTIHARATVPNADLFLVPGEFAHLQLSTGLATDALLIPEASVLTDQSHQVVLTVAEDGTVVPKVVVLGARYDNLRVVQSGISADDKVIIDGLMRATPGGKVKPEAGTINDTTVAAN